MQLALAGKSALAFWIWAARPTSYLSDLLPIHGHSSKLLTHDALAQGAPLKMLIKREKKPLPLSFKTSITRAEANNLSRELEQTEPLHILVSNKNERRHGNNIHAQLMQNAAQVDAFYEPIKGLYVSAPELVFTQLSSQLPLTHLIMLGYELCGEYSVDVKTERGFTARPSLMKQEDLAKLFSAGCHLGQKRLSLQAISCALEGTASPAESQLAALLTTPTRLGGFGFSAPKPNAIVLQDARSQEVSGKHWRACDLLWEDERVDVEYDSEAFHSTREQRYQDSVRRNALTNSGFKVISVTPNQLQSLDEMRTVARVLARALSKRTRIRISGYEQMQRELHRAVLWEYPKWRRSVFGEPGSAEGSRNVDDAEMLQASGEVETEPFYEPA